MNYDVAIIGGGASGLACAVRLLRNAPKLNIAVIERGERLGKQRASTGNGQRNVTNTDMSAEHYFGNKALVQKIALSSDRISLEERLFHCMLNADELGRVYPVGRQASALVDSLIHDLRRGGADILLNTRVTAIDKSLKITLSSGQTLTANFAVLCTGGKAQKQYKTDGSSYALAQSLGHGLTPLYPSLVQLKTDTEHIKSLKGIRVYCGVTAFVNGQALARTRGDVIFTEYGVSGNAIFAISPYVAERRGVVLSLNFLPFEDGKIISNIEEKKKSGYPDGELLSGTLHNQLGRAIIRRCGSNRAEDVCRAAKSFTLDVVGTLGFDYAQVTRGGVETDGVTEELESKYVSNLFLAGELLDVDGCCGGYNLHWAFSSGYAAADGILKRL